jgi:hypothetical protein
MYLFFSSFCNFFILVVQKISFTKMTLTHFFKKTYFLEFIFKTKKKCFR